MARRRRDPEAALPAEPSSLESGPRIDVRMTGTADEVKRQLGVTEKPSDASPQAPVQDLERFANLLRNPKFIVKVKRLRPKMWQGQKANVEVWTSELPLQWEEIKSEVTLTSKGGTYKVSVIDPQSGTVVDAQNFEVEGDPLLESPEMSPEEKAMFGTPEKDAAQITEEGLERTARMTAKQIEVETLQQNLQELRNRTVNGGKKSHDLDPRIDDLERRLVEAKHQAEIEARDRKHSEEMKELRNLIAQNQKPAQPQGQSEIAALIAQMQKNQESADKRFEALQKQMQDDKLNALLDEVKAIKNRPQDKGGLLETVEVILKLKKFMGWGGGDDDDEDGDDDRPWYERALDKLGDKFIPKLIDKLDGLEASGKKILTKDDFIREVGPELDAYAKELAEKELAKRNLPPSKEPAALPAPPAAPPKAEVASAIQANPTAVPSAPDAPPAPHVPSVQERICQMAAGAVAMIEAEIQIRPNNFEWHWNLWDELPQAILVRVCEASGPVEMFDAFKVEGLNHQEIDKIKQKIAADKDLIAWLSTGFTELKGWWEKKKKDPSFDPEEEEVET